MMLAPVTSTGLDYQQLYKLLAERTPQQSISHKSMPRWEEHCAFVDSKPYLAWYMVCDRNAVMGAVYLSKQREIGVSIFQAYQRQGYGKAAVQELMRLHPGRFLANINPDNVDSVAFFEKLGFRALQVTYAYDSR